MNDVVGGDIPARVDRVLAEAVGRGASDVHVEPVAEGYEVRFRIDGELGVVERAPADVGRAMVTRLMVLARLLTYRMDVPQEGKLEARLPGVVDRELELRVAVIPTVRGPRAAVRLPAELLQPRTLEALELPPAAHEGLVRYARADAGMLVIGGPAGSGKTTTLYALLGKMAEVRPGLSLITLEDPVERRLPGVTQVEVSPFGQLTYEKALRSILRQDPQVLMLGEVRDAATASLAVQAALSGHRLLCTLHASDPAGAIARLLEMGLEPYQVAGALWGVLSQRLVRRRRPDGTFQGRIPVAEFVGVDEALREAILKRSDVETLRKAYASRPGHVTLRASAEALVAAGVTGEEEVRRALGA